MKHWSRKLENENEHIRSFVYTAGSPTMAKYLADAITSNSDQIRYHFNPEFQDNVVFHAVLNVPSDMTKTHELWKWVLLVNAEDQICEFWLSKNGVDGGDVQLGYKSKLVQKLIENASEKVDTEYRMIMTELSDLLK